VVTAPYLPVAEPVVLGSASTASSMLPTISLK
jgi:hypothetical protein